MISDTMQTLVSRYFAATRAMDLDAWLSCFADDAVSYDPYGAPPTQGKEGLKRFFLSVAGALKEITFIEDYVVITGNRAAVKFTARGVGLNGKPVTAEGIDVFESNECGTIQTMWGYWDPAAMMAQLQN
jgi:steroid delta-isomerase